MSDTSQSPTGQQQGIKPSAATMTGLVVVSSIIAVLVLILYLPTLSAPAMYDEHYLLAWWKNLIQAGLFSHESLAFLNFAGFDLRDGNGPYGNLSNLCLVAITAGKIGLIHFAAVSLHLGNSLLLFIASLRAQHLANSQSTETSLACFATSAIAALLFALSPLAPEAVSWLGGFPLQIGTTFSLIAFLLLSFSANSIDKKRSIILSGAAGSLAMIASLCSVHLAVVVFFPAVCIYLATKDSARQEKTTSQTSSQKNTRLLLIMYLIGASAGALYSSFNYLGHSPSDASNPLNLPPKIVALTEAKVEAQTEANELSVLSKPLGNVSALVIPINRSINKNYNKTFKLSYLLFPAPLVLSLIALMLSIQFRNRIGIALGFAFIYLLLNREIVDRETLMGARWLYPILPTFSFLVATTLASPLFIQYNKIENNLVVRTIKALASVLLVVLTLLFLIPLTHTQISSYKSQGKLWSKLSQSIEMLGGREKSAYLILRNLPQTLSIAPIISPFEPILIDTAEKLPRSQNISAGALKDCLRDQSRDAKIGNIAFHFEKQLVDLIKTDFEVTNENFQSPLTAQQIAKRVTPPLEFYNGAVKLDSTGENLLLESGNTNGAALRIDCEGISPLEGDYLYVEAKIDGPPLRPHTPVELHWLTNWNSEWEPRDRRTQVDAFSNDNQYHRYFFPLRSTSWTTNGFPSYIMLGFPAGAKVAVKAIGVAKSAVAEAVAEEVTAQVAAAGTELQSTAEPATKAAAETVVAPPVPLLTAQASITQSPNKRRFSAFSFNYPDLKVLGLTAVYGRDNTLMLSYDASKIDSAAAVKFEIGLADSKFKADNAEYPDASSTTIDQKDAKGTLILKHTDQPLASKTASTGTVFPIRIFALDQSGKIIGRSSDSVHCLIDWNLSAK
ncbi:MAG: hypothetical protein WC028_07215 [Candidatus Obscuribacterales bacterium]